MGKMEQMLKAEITRLAKKQVRATYLPLVQDVRRLKRIVSALGKTVAVLARLGTELQAERTAEQSKLTVAPQEVKAAPGSAHSRQQRQPACSGDCQPDKGLTCNGETRVGALDGAGHGGLRGPATQRRLQGHRRDTAVTRAGAPSPQPTAKSAR
jgi:hypothetical protein